MKSADDLVPTPGPRRGRDDLVAAPPERGWLLPAVRWVLRTLTWIAPQPRRPGAVDAMLVLSLGGLAACAVFADTGAGPVLVSLAWYRQGHVTVHRARSLLEPEPRDDPGRTLVTAAVNLAEVVFVTAAVFRWSRELGLGVAIRAGFDVVTFRGASGLAGTAGDVAVALGTVTAAVIFFDALRAAVAGTRSR